MKWFAGVGLLGFLAIFLYWMSASTGGKDSGVSIQIAFGNATAKEIEIHVVVGVVMANQDRIKKGEKIKSWPEWIQDHFDLQDSSGNELELARTNHSRLIKPHQIVGTQEFFMVAKLKIGEDYTLDYIPDTDEPQRYRSQFVAPSAAAKVRQCAFKPVK